MKARAKASAVSAAATVPKLVDVKLQYNFDVPEGPGEWCVTLIDPTAPAEPVGYGEGRTPEAAFWRAVRWRQK